VNSFKLHQPLHICFRELTDHLLQASQRAGFIFRFNRSLLHRFQGRLHVPGHVDGTDHDAGKRKAGIRQTTGQLLPHSPF
jgi:hypothetical protein